MGKKKRASKEKKRVGKKSGDETGHRQGKKLSKKHTTSIKEAGVVVDAARKMPEVTKVSLGIIKRLSGGTPRLKFTEINGGFSIAVRGRTAIQQMVVYTSDLEKTRKGIEAAFAKKVR